jgi:hypothetical protein
MKIKNSASLYINALKLNQRNMLNQMQSNARSTPAELSRRYRPLGAMVCNCVKGVYQRRIIGDTRTVSYARSRNCFVSQQRVLDYFSEGISFWAMLKSFIERRGNDLSQRRC